MAVFDESLCFFVMSFTNTTLFLLISQSVLAVLTILAQKEEVEKKDFLSYFQGL